jgi:hypothetical protein
VKDLILSGMVEELMPSAPELAVHICRSHVLRSLICVLGGVHLQQPEGHSVRRGREKAEEKEETKKSTQNHSLVTNPGTLDMRFAPKGSRVIADETRLQRLLGTVLGIAETRRTAENGLSSQCWAAVNSIPSHFELLLLRQTRNIGTNKTVAAATINSVFTKHNPNSS